MIEVGTGEIAIEINNLNDLSAFDFSKDGRYLVIGSSKGTVTVWVISGSIRGNISQVLDSMTVNPNFWSNYPLYLPIEGVEEKQIYGAENKEIEDHKEELAREAEDQLKEPIQMKTKPTALSKISLSYTIQQPLYKSLSDFLPSSNVCPPQHFKPIDHFKAPPSRTQVAKTTHVLQGSKPEINLSEESKKFQRPHTFYKATKDLYEVKQSTISPANKQSAGDERVLASREQEEVQEKRRTLYTSQEDAMAVLLDKAINEPTKLIAPDPEDIDQEEDEEGRKSISGIDSMSGCDVVDKMYEEIQVYEEKYKRVIQP